MNVQQNIAPTRRLMDARSGPVRLTAADDAALLARMSAGDEQALGVLYDRWEHAVRTFSIRMAPLSVETEYRVEQVFWEAWIHASSFDPSRGGVDEWLMGIARTNSPPSRLAT